MSIVKIIQGDITLLSVDAIVNAANSNLSGGGGVDGAIHQAAGPELDIACAKLNGCPTGEAKTTPGFKLPAKYIIHTPGPIWRGGKNHEDKLLAMCYISSLREAELHNCQSVAFPSISTGVYRFPLQIAANIAIQTLINYSRTSDKIKEITVVAFDPVTKSAYEGALKSSTS